jgi:DNA polymerase-1
MQVDNLIIDGTNIEFRVFIIAEGMNARYGSSDEPITASEREQTNCTYRFLQTFHKLVEQFNPTNIYAGWDKKLQPNSTNFRKDILVDQYKAGRVRPPNIQEMYDQEIKLIEMLESLGVRNIFPNVLEADDVCAWLSHTLEGNTVVVSVDQDLLQLVTPTVSVFNLDKIITYENFKELKGVSPEDFVLYKAIKGDASDNIAGLDGYGEVRSRKLATNWNTTNITEDYKLIIDRNTKLIDLRFGYNYQSGEKQKYEEQLSYLKNVKHDIEQFKRLCEKYNFVTILRNIDKWKRMVKRNNIVDIINSIRINN